MSGRDRLKWQCRRGARELDLLLERYFDAAYAQAGDEEKELFTELLCWEDDALLAVLMGGKAPPKPGFDALIEKMRALPLP